MTLTPGELRLGQNDPFVGFRAPFFCPLLSSPLLSSPPLSFLLPKRRSLSGEERRERRGEGRGEERRGEERRGEEKGRERGERREERGERRGEEKGREQRKAVAFLAQAEGPWFGGQNVEAAEKLGGGKFSGGENFRRDTVRH